MIRSGEQRLEVGDSPGGQGIAVPRLLWVQQHEAGWVGGGDGGICAGSLRPS